MRQLTRQEIDDAPDWADKYYDNTQGNLFYFDSLTGRSKGVYFCVEVSSLPSEHYSFARAKPIPRKEFDIKSYEFDDPILSVSESSKESIAFNCYTRETVKLTREDWIAGAKHFKLTAEDLS